ncbi:MAG: hypothetical protein CME71_07085 [Halobacteriovorax sp.]|nr:hypothetical protein [Halobacteriovorax sp.]
MTKNSNEFIDFLTQETKPMPETSRANILAKMKQKLAPPIKDIWPKFVSAQLIACLATLSVCPQFGVGPITGGHGLGHLFMSFGEAACAAFCGAFFLATGTAAAALMLRAGERRELFNYRFRIIGAVAVSTFLVFMILGKTLELPMLFSGLLPTVSWLVAAMGSALLVLQLALPKKAKSIIHKN